MDKQEIITIDPETMSGQPVFKGTRVPVSIFWDYLEGGSSMDEFLAQYPSVRRELAVALLAEARNRMGTDARAA